ncbi:MAG: ABC transporter permease [Candidatus Acidiferrum sp.]
MNTLHSFVRQLANRVGSFFGRDKLDREFAAEMDEHLHMAIEENLRAGLSPEEARRRALVQFGGQQQAKEAVREQRSLPFLETLFQDFRFAARLLKKSPAFTSVAVLTLALGVGATTAIFSVAQAALLRSWPAKSPEQLAKLIATTPQGRDNYFSYPDYRELSEQTTLLSGIAAWSRHGKTLRIGSDLHLVLNDVVSPNYFEVLGLDAQLGRMFSADSASSAEHTVVISDALWRRLFHADPSLIGKPIWFNDGSYTVIGIAPPHFQGLEREVPTDLWFTVLSEYGQENLGERKFRDFELLARLRPGVTSAQAQTELSILGRRLSDSYPAVDKAREVGLIPEPERLRSALVASAVLMSFVGLVLLICCANVAGLIVARSDSRRREIAVRLALGAGRLRLVRQLLTEGILLAFAGAALGLLFASWLMSLQSALLPPFDYPIGLDLRLDSTLVAFSLVVSALCVLLFGLAPALQSSKSNLVSALKGEEATAGRSFRKVTLRNAIVLGEIALSVVLLAASGLLIRSLVFTRSINLGFDKQKSLVFVDLNAGLSGYNPTRSLSFFEQITERAAHLPGVQHASFARRMLLTGSGGGAQLLVSIPGVDLPQGQQSIPIKFNAVGGDYFRTLGTRLLAGRDLTAADGPTAARVVLISQNMAARFWPDNTAVGRHISLEGKDCEIIGVVEDAKIIRVHEPAEPYMYLPFTQWPTESATLLVDVSGDPGPVVPALRSELASLDQAVPATVHTLHYLMQQAFWEDQMAAAFVAVLGLVGVFLSSIGLYGVIAFLVNQRRHEIGIRMALGADRRDVLRMVLSQGLALAVIGLILGIAASLAAMPLLASALYGVKPADPLTYVAGSVLVLFVALAASYFPARRASRVDPIIALRYE